MYDSVTIAEYIRSLAYEKRMMLNMTQIQKLLYLAYGYFIAHKGVVISTEAPKAWPFGPVYPRVHKKIKLNAPIKDIQDDIFCEINGDKELKNKLTEIVEKYSKYSATQLSDWSHIENGPWDKTTKQPNFKWGVTEIPQNYIKEYFSTLTV